MRRYILPILAYAVALPITLLAEFRVELAAVALLAGVWFVCAVLFSGSPL